MSTPDVYPIRSSLFLADRVVRRYSLLSILNQRQFFSGGKGVIVFWTPNVYFSVWTIWWYLSLNEIARPPQACKHVYFTHSGQTYKKELSLGPTGQ